MGVFSYFRDACSKQRRPHIKAQYLPLNIADPKSLIEATLSRFNAFDAGAVKFDGDSSGH